MDDLNDCQLLEHPNETIRRLKSLGVWPEANRLLRKLKQRFRRLAANSDTAMSMAQRLDMNRAAWEAVLQRWPPPPDAPPLESLASYLKSTNNGDRHSDAGGTATLPPDAERRFKQIGETANHIDEVLWVYQHLDDEQVGPLDAPSRGAWSLLSHSRAQKDRFYEKVYLPLIRDISRRQKAAPVPGKMSDRERRDIDSIKEQLRKARIASQNFGV